MSAFEKYIAEEERYIEDCRTADLDIERIKYFKKERAINNGSRNNKNIKYLRENP